MIQSKQDYKYYLQQDLIANSITHISLFRRVAEYLLCQDTIYRFVLTLRKLEYLTNCPSIFNRLSWLLTKRRFNRLSLKLGFSIPINVCGPGLSLPHYGTIVISTHAKIGCFCRIHAGVNIGASAGQTEAADIGDCVYIGPGSILIGNITIPSHSTIGANSTVNKSFENEYTVIAGSPAKICKTDYNDWTQFNRIDQFNQK